MHPLKCIHYIIQPVSTSFHHSFITLHYIYTVSQSVNFSVPFRMCGTMTIYLANRIFITSTFMRQRTPNNPPLNTLHYTTLHYSTLHYTQRNVCVIMYSWMLFLTITLVRMYFCSWIFYCCILKLFSFCVFPLNTWMISIYLGFQCTFSYYSSACT